MQSLMKIYKEYADLGNMLQFGYCAAFMQHYAATCSFFLNTFNTPKYKNITLPQTIMYNKASVFQLYNYH